MTTPPRPAPLLTSRVRAGACLGLLLVPFVLAGCTREPEVSRTFTIPSQNDVPLVSFTYAVEIDPNNFPVEVAGELPGVSRIYALLRPPEGGEFFVADFTIDELPIDLTAVIGGPASGAAPRLTPADVQRVGGAPVVAYRCLLIDPPNREGNRTWDTVIVATADGVVALVRDYGSPKGEIPVVPPSWADTVATLQVLADPYTGDGTGPGEQWWILSPLREGSEEALYDCASLDLDDLAAQGGQPGILPPATPTG